MRQDLIESLRAVFRTPLLSGFVVLSLGLGLGPNAAVFSLVDAVLLRPLPYDDADRLVLVRGGLREDGVDDMLLPGGVFSELRAATRIDEAAAVGAIRQNLTGAGLPAQVQVGWTSPNLFRMLGVSPVLGRGFQDQEPAGSVLLAHEFWRSQFASDPAVPGRQVFLDGFPHVIVGVLPPGFRLEVPRLPPDVDLWKSPDTWWQNGDVWSSTDFTNGLFRLVGRLRDGSGVEAARSEVEAIGARVRERNVGLARSGFFLAADPLHASLVARVRGGLWLLLGATGAVLLVACANVTNLQLVRGQRRSRELALRLALGASRGRLLRMLLFEALWLAAAGGVLGLALAGLGLGVVEVLGPPDLPRADGARIDLVVLGYAAALCAATVLLSGLAPAVVATRRDPSRDLHGSRGSTVGPGRQRLNGALVATQLALSLVLLLAGTVLGRSLLALNAVPLGFASEGLLTFTVSLPGTRYARPAGPDRFLARLCEAVEALPGARSAAAIWPLPFTGRRWSNLYEAGSVGEEQRAYADYRLVSPPLFETIGAAVVEGRSFNPADERHTVVVSRSLAERAFGDRGALGRALRANPWGGRTEEFRIVGVVDDQRHRSRRDPPSDAVYFDSRGWAWTDWEIGVVVRADGEPAALVEPIRRELARLDPEVPMADVLPMSERVARDSRSLRFALTLLAGSASVAVMLALVGLYGVVSWMVAQRTREIGIRLALGATRGRVLTRVLAHAAGIAALGSILGLAASAAAVRLLGGLLHGVGPGEPRTLLTAGLFLFGAALGAAWFPAWRAAALDPTRTLRAE